MWHSVVPMVDQRLTWLTRRPTPWSAVVPLVALAAGAMFATSAATADGTDLRSSRHRPARPDPRGVPARTPRPPSGCSRLRAEVDRLSAQQAPGDLRVTQLNGKADALTLRRGHPERRPARPSGSRSTTPPNGPARCPTASASDDYVVHQQDVQAVVNALWADGAEAMMLMDQRVISTSAVRCVGNTLILQGRVYSPPYVITAIGDQRAMRDARSTPPPRSPIYRDYVDAVGLGYHVDDPGDDDIPAYAGSIKLQHARPVSGDGARVAGEPPGDAVRRSGVLGELLITAGSLLLLFVGWQLWWTDVTADPRAAGTDQALSRTSGRPAAAPPRRAATTAGARSRSARRSRSCTSRGSAPATPRPVLEGTGRTCSRRAWATTADTALPGAVGNFAHRRPPGHLRPSRSTEIDRAARRRPDRASRPRTWYLPRHP